MIFWRNDGHYRDGDAMQSADPRMRVETLADKLPLL